MNEVPILTRVLAPVGAVAMAIGLFVPYAALDISSFTDNTSIIDLDELSYFYVGLDVLVAAAAAAAIPFLLRASVLCGSLLITLGALSFLSLIEYVLRPLRGGDDDIYLRPGAIIGLAGALLVIAAGVIALLAPRYVATVAPSPRPTQPMQPMQPPPGWYPDPSGSAAQRYWNGTAWSTETR